MLRTLVIASALAFGLALPAQAGGCPGLVKDVTAKLQQSKLPAAKKAEIAKLRDQGNMLHKQGKHDESMAVLRRAQSMLK
jgi:hypothetical protein